MDVEVTGKLKVAGLEMIIFDLRENLIPNLGEGENVERFYLNNALWYMGMALSEMKKERQS